MPASPPRSPSPPQATPPPNHQYGSELERRAAEVRREKAERAKFIAQHEAESATFALALERPCADHGAAPGKPCWRLPLDEKHHRAGRGVCGARLSLAIGVARLRAQREAREAKQRTKTTTTTTKRPAMTRWIHASHADGALEAELRQAQTDRLLAIERTRDAAHQPQADPEPSADEKPAAKRLNTKPPPKPPPRAQVLAPSPSTPPPPQVLSLPPGAVIITAEEMRSIDRLLETHPETSHLFKKGQR